MDLPTKTTSDACSRDGPERGVLCKKEAIVLATQLTNVAKTSDGALLPPVIVIFRPVDEAGSEERRVGKECRL